MEDVLMAWPLEASSLETLQPLSFSVLDDQETSINLDKLSRSEIAGKLQDHLDQIAERQETEPFDWFSSTEKSIDIPIFDNISSSSIPVGFQNNNVVDKLGQAPSHYTYFDSPEYEPTFAPTNYAFAGAAAPEATQPQLTYVPSFDTSLTMSNSPLVGQQPSPPAGIPHSPPFVDVNAKNEEVLTPPDSPKDEEILKLLQEIEPGDWDRLMFGEREEGADPPTVDTSIISENSCSPVDELSDYAASSPYVGSESGSDNDTDYSPKSVRKVGGSGNRAAGSMSRRRASKPYSRPSVEERRLRKKEQNKNAATRYRMKKKQEVEECKIEEKRLADRNRELRNKLDDISREIKCLKSLMRDVYRKNGLWKK